jgi:uncharacterized protein
MYQASVPVFLRRLKTLSGILYNAAAAAAKRKIDPTVFLTARLAPDMYTLARQVQIASDHAKGATARLAGVEVPKFEDVEKNFEELQQRLTRVTEFVQTFDAAKFDGQKSGRSVFPSAHAR